MNCLCSRQLEFFMLCSFLRIISVFCTNSWQSSSDLHWFRGPYVLWKNCTEYREENWQTHPTRLLQPNVSVLLKAE